MFETLESRQFFSVSALGDGPVAPAPGPTADTVVENKPKPKPTTTQTQTYLVVTMSDVLISS